MPVLEDARAELYCQERVSGRSILDSFEASGHTRDTGNASNYNAKPHIQARMAELKTAAAERVEITQSYVLSSIMGTVERCKQAAPVLDRKGEIVMVETPNGDIAPAYVFDARSVLRGSELLGKHIGMFKEAQAEPPVVNVVISDTELARLIAFQLTKASKES